MDIDDPWDWAIDRLVQELCTENRTWQSSVNNASRPDPEALETKLRDNAVVGTTILLDVGDSEMKDDLGITKLGHRSWMRDAIRALQLRSPKYHSYRHTHTIGSDLFHTTSHRGVQPGGSHESVSVADLVVPTTNRGNADPPFPILSSITPDDSEGQPGTDGEHPTGSPNRKKPKLDNATAVIDNDLLGAAMTGDSPIEEPHGAQGALDAMADVPVSGCLSFVDVNGKKRKRLAPTLVTTVIDPTRNRDILTYAEEAIRFKLHNEPISLDPAVDFENPDLDADNVVDFDSRSGTSSFQPVAESTEPRLDAGQNSEFIAQRLSMTPPPFVEPGKPYIDLNGRKRMLPIVQSNVDILEPREQGNTVLEESPDVQGPVSSDATIGDGNIKFVVAEARNTASKIPPPSYLDRKRFLVDDVFYENTAIGADASLPEAELEFVVAPTKLPPGRRLYVHSVMKRFFRSEPIAFTRGGKEMFAVVPYSPELRPKFSTTSFTLYRPVEGHIDITRENIASWPEVGSKDDTHLVSDIEGRTVTFNPAGPDMLESMMNKNNEWNYEALEKYMGVEGGDEILPAYGESDSDNDYDEATLREIEADKGIKLDRKVGKSRKPPLSAQEVEFIIDEAVASHATRWRENKLPKIQHKAYKIWCKSRKQKSLKLDIKAIKNELESLETRLQKLRDAISKQPWTSRIQVLKQSTILEGTVFDREAAKWTMGVLGSKERPEKPAKQTPKVKLPKVAVEEEGESLEDEPESSSSGESLDDFIASEDSGCEENCELNLADAEISDNAMTMSDASLSESPVTPDKKIKIIYQGSSFRHPSEVFSKPASPNTGSDSALLSPKIEDSTPGKLSMPKTHNSGDIIELSSDDNQVIYDLVTPEKRRPKIILRHTPPKFAGSGAITITDDETASPSPPRVRDLKNDPVAISKLSFKDWEARKDRRGLLIAVFQKMTAELRRRTFNLLSRLNAAHLWVHMNNVMSACAMQDFHVPGMGVSLYDLVIVVVALYEIYVDCKYRRYTIPPNPLKIQALRGAQMHEHYGPFHQLCLEIVNVFKGRTSKPSTAPSSIIFKKSKIGKISDQERALEEDAGFQSSGKSQTPATEPSEDEEDGEPVSAIRNRRPQLAPSMSEDDLTPDDIPRKKRKKLLENTDAKDLREQNLARKAAQDERRMRLQLKLSQTGHGNDEDHGQIIINDAKSDDQGYILVTNNTAPRIKKHQIEGVRFMWNQLVGDGDAMQGCLLAHTMGLGKTMQVITLLVAIAEASLSDDPTVRSQIPPRLRQSRTLVLCPPTIIDNWLDELLTWAPHNLLGDILKVDSTVKIPSRLPYISHWYKEGGVLLMGYGMFRTFIQNNATKTREAKYDDEQHAQILKALLEGPNIIIADEAHKLKNPKSGVSTAAFQFKSMSRIALTGSPLSNNVTEYHTMIDWVAPNYLGPIAEFNQKYVQPIEEGLYQDSTGYQRRKSLKMLAVLKEDIAPKVHRADMSVLRHDLPPMKEFIIFVPLTNLQKMAYSLYVRLMTSGEGRTTKDGDLTQNTIWHWIAVLQLLCNHPACFHTKLNDRKSDAKEAAASQENAVSTSKDDGDPDDLSIWKTGASDILVNRELALFNKECDDIETPSLSNKVKILCQILDAAREAQDKVLVFSQSIPTLNFLEKLLRSQGRSLSRLDGKTDMGSRQTMTKNFNTNNTEIYLISTTAGGLGLNLPGANRVVIFDFKFNPIEEEQAIGRAYRIGQKKPTFVYRLICGGTFEEVIQNKTIYKTQLASQVVDKKSVIAYAKKKMSEFLFEPKLVEQHDISEFTGLDPQVLDRLLLSEKDSGILRKILQSDTFAQDDKNVLDAAEQKEVKEMLDDEKLKRTNPQAYAAKQAAHIAKTQELARAHARQTEAARMHVNARAQIQLQQSNATKANVQPQQKVIPLNSSEAGPASIIPPISTPTRAVETRILPPSSQTSASVPVTPSSTQTPAESTLFKSAEFDLPPTKNTSLGERQQNGPIRPPIVVKHTTSPLIRRGQSPILGAGTRAGSTSSESTPSQVIAKSPNHKKVNALRSDQSLERSRHDVRNTPMYAAMSKRPSVNSLKTSVIKKPPRSAAEKHARDARKASERRKAQHKSQPLAVQLPDWAKDELARSSTTSNRRRSVTSSSQRAVTPSSAKGNPQIEPPSSAPPRPL